MAGQHINSKKAKSISNKNDIRETEMKVRLCKTINLS